MPRSLVISQGNTQSEDSMIDIDVADLSRVAVILMTWNSERYFDLLSGPLLRQGIRPEQVLVVDSESKDRTVERAKSLGFRVNIISKSEFDHGGSRAVAASLVPSAEILVYITPDAIMATPDALAKLVSIFDDPQVGAAYGRQLPHKDADPFARHERIFNYPAGSVMRDLETRKILGFRTIFLSDSFAAYRRTALESSGNFPARIITAEDFYVAGKMMLQGWKTAYVAEAQIYHSHNLTLTQIFRRYFDIGVLHIRENWMCKEYGEPGGEGYRYFRAELAFIWGQNPFLIPMVFLRTASKYMGYQLGKREAWLPISVKRRIGGLREFWKS